jgi:hypothetical protein
MLRNRYLAMDARSDSDIPAFRRHVSNIIHVNMGHQRGLNVIQMTIGLGRVLHYRASVDCATVG